MRTFTFSYMWFDLAAQSPAHVATVAKTSRDMLRGPDGGARD